MGQQQTVADAVQSRVVARMLVKPHDIVSGATLLSDILSRRANAMLRD